MTAPFAFGVLEQKRLLAMLTEKKFHAQLPRCLIMTVGDRGLGAALQGQTVWLAYQHGSCAPTLAKVGGVSGANGARRGAPGAVSWRLVKKTGAGPLALT